LQQYRHLADIHTTSHQCLLSGIKRTSDRDRQKYLSDGPSFNLLSKNYRVEIRTLLYPALGRSPLAFLFLGGPAHIYFE